MTCAATLAQNLPLGSMYDQVVVPSYVSEHAAALGQAMCKTAEAEEFCGDLVETHAIPLWAT